MPTGGWSEHEIPFTHSKNDGLADSREGRRHIARPRKDRTVAQGQDEQKPVNAQTELLLARGVGSKGRGPAAE